MTTSSSGRPGESRSAVVTFGQHTDPRARPASARTCVVAALVLGLGVAGCTGTADPPPSTGASSPPSTPSATTPRDGALPWPKPPSGVLAPSTGAALQAELQRWVDLGQIHGVTAAVVTPDGVWSGAAGVDGEGTAVQPRSGMALASITKTFAAAEVMLLAERGAVDLDAPVSTYLPNRWVSNGVTVRQLLAQRSGLTEAPDAAWERLGAAPDEHWSPRRFMALVPTPTREPGGGFNYDNSNYMLLTMLIEQVTGQHAAAVLQRDLWQPLGLERLAYQDEQALPPPLAAPGADDGVPAGAATTPYVPFRSIAGATGGAGGMAGDAATVARWGYDLYGGLLLAPESVAQMTDFSDGDGYGLGTFDFTADFWFSANIDGYGHVGEMPGYNTVVAVYPERETSIAILTSSAAEPVNYVRLLAKLVAPG